MFADLEKYWLADKELSISPNWRRRREREEFVRLVSPLDIAGVTEEGLRFTASAHIYAPDRQVVFQIEYETLTYPRGVPMARFEWRPTSPHNNKGIGPPDHRYKVIRGTHIHPFDLNWQHSEGQVRKGSLPIAVPVEPPIESYKDALAFVENNFRIRGVTTLPLPPWERKAWL